MSLGRKTATYLMIGLATLLNVGLTLLLNLAENFTTVTIICAILRTSLGACTSIFAVATVLSKKFQNEIQLDI